MDKVSKTKRSEIMSRIRDRDSKMEVDFRKALWQLGYRYRKNPSGYFGKPDILLKSRKIVIFLDSCFWHGCKKHCQLPETRKEFWKQKISRNRRRDGEVSRYYKNHDWKIFRYWEHDLRERFPQIMAVWKTRRTREKQG
ncbi:MAG: very short patch repair endonuclease [Candidatus Zixiibacteriota bacterium]